MEEWTSGIKDARYKAKLVAKCYSQISGVDFTDLFSLVAKDSSIRTLLAKNDLGPELMDVKTTFLHKKT